MTKIRARNDEAQKRVRALVDSLREGMDSSDAVFATFEELDRMPREVVQDELASWVGPPPDLDRLDDETRRAHRLPPRSLRLHTLALVRDADVLDLGPVADEQIRLAGKHWDGRDLPAEERLDGELDDSFAGTLEHRVLGEDEKPLFDVLRYAETSGIIFRAGTTKVIGGIADGRVECADRATREAIQEALGVAHVEPEEAPAPPAKKKRASAKKKTSSAKRPSAKKKTKARAKS